MSSPLSAFTAIPNPQMPAFLGAQSFIMMYQAGEGWQYGKRRISALSNEDFNKITPQSLMERQAMELKGAIPVMERSMNNMTRMVPMIIEQYGDFIREAIKAMPQMIANIQGANDVTNPDEVTINGKTYARGTLTFGMLLGLGTLVPRTGLGKYSPAMKGGTIPAGVSISSGSGSQLAAYESTHEQRVAIQRLETARMDRIAADLEAKRAAVARLDIRNIPTPTVTWTKAAGQSQILEKARLVQKIKEDRAGIQNSVGAQKQLWENRLIRDQQSLANLLARYRF